MSKSEMIKKVGDRVFLNPSPLFSYEYLAKNSLASNTYRGFHKIDKLKPGASVIFVKFLLENKKFITENLNNASSENDISKIEDELCEKLLGELKVNIRNDQLASYNKLRKPMDIVFQHMTAMGDLRDPHKLLPHIIHTLSDRPVSSTTELSTAKFALALADNIAYLY